MRLEAEGDKVGAGVQEPAPAESGEKAAVREGEAAVGLEAMAVAVCSLTCHRRTSKGLKSFINRGWQLRRYVYIHNR